jgi:aspartate aminotransferase/aminotransferase
MTTDLSTRAMPLARRVQAIPEALSIYINQLVYDLRRRQHDIITLSLGESFFEIPYFDFRQLDFSRGYHYSDSRGLPTLRAKIAEYYQTRYRAPIRAEDIIVSAGSKPLLFMCMQAVVEEGEEILIHEPAWLSYKEQARLVGAAVRSIPYDQSCEAFVEHFSDATRMLILNNPNNPAGRTYTKRELLTLYRQCRERGVYLLVDEAYSDFVLDDSFVSVANVVPSLDGAIAVNSLSKNMGMSGWRIGYVIAEPRLLNALLKLNQHIITCAPTILQQYMAEYFDEILAHTLAQVRGVVEKRERLAKRLTDIGLRYMPGGATFYFFVETGAYAGDIHDLALHLLLEQGISVVPGSAYGATTGNFLRVSIGTESEERIDQAMLVLHDLLIGPPVDRVRVHAELARLGLPEFIPAPG